MNYVNGHKSCTLFEIEYYKFCKILNNTNLDKNVDFKYLKNIRYSTQSVQNHVIKTIIMCFILTSKSAFFET